MNLRKIAAFASAAAMSLAMLHSYPAQTFEIDWNFAANAADSVAINATNFPDEIFRSYVSNNFDTNSDGALSTAEIANVTGVYVSEMGILSLEGVEYFVGLEGLFCEENMLTTIDVSKNTALKSLNCYNNLLTTIDVSRNTMLGYLNCSSNHLMSLDISKNDMLCYLDCSDNQLTTLDVSKNTALEELYCYNNQLTTLDVSSNIALEVLICHYNSLRTLDVSNNTSLWDLLCSNNELTSLDVSNNTYLEYLTCDNNQLTTLNICGNTMLKRLNCGNNRLTVLDVSGCAVLEDLICEGNQLITLDMSNNVMLWSLSCGDNPLTELDVSRNYALLFLYCDYAKLTSINVSKNEYLYVLFCDNNHLTSLDISKNERLDDLSCTLNTYHIGAVGEKYTLSLLPGNFDVAKASNWQGATCENGVLTNFVGIDGENKITYDYDAGNGETVEFTLTYTLAEEVSGIIGTGLSADISLEDITYISDDNLPVISFTASVDYRGNEYYLDISDYIMVSADTDIDPTLDMTATGTGDESVSAFDLYWSAYNAGIPTTEFTCEYKFDMSRIDELFCELTAISGLGMNYEDNADYFECILYEDGEAILIGDEPYTCKVAQRGDANLDHAVDARDAASMSKYCSLVASGADNPELTTDNNELAKFVGDVNSDGVIDTRDAASASKYASTKANHIGGSSEAEVYYNIWNEMGIFN